MDANHDVTVLKKAREEVEIARKALRLKSEELERYFSSSLDLLCIADTDGHFLRVNAEWEKILGYSADDLNGRLFLDFVHPDDMEATLAAISELRDQKEVLSFENRYLCNDGSYRWIEWRSRPQGNIIYAVARDVTERRLLEERLRENEQRLKILLNNIPDSFLYQVIIETDGTSRFGYISDGIRHLHGLTAEDVIIDPSLLYNQMSPEDRNRVMEAEAGSVRDMTELNIDISYHTANGEPRWSHLRSTPRRLPDGVIIYDGIETDITERKKAENLLSSERRRLANIIEGTNTGTWEWNIQTGETVFNERWAEIIGYTLEEISPISIATWEKFSHPDDLKLSGNLLEKHFKEELPYYEIETRMLHKSGAWVWVLDRGKVTSWTSDGKPLLMFGTHQDITERKQAEEKIKHLAGHDSLTDLPTMRLAQDRLSMALSMAHRNREMAAVMFVDLDGFKAVNDSLGHNAGDYLLTQVAKRMLSCVRETDTVARVGGDEFLIIITGLKIKEKALLYMEKIAEKIINSLSRPVTVDGKQAAVSASIGIAMYPDHGADNDALIKKADKAMYRVKNTGKNSFCFADRQE